MKFRRIEYERITDKLSVFGINIPPSSNVQSIRQKSKSYFSPFVVMMVCPLCNNLLKASRDWILSKLIIYENPPSLGSSILFASDSPLMALG